MQSDDGSEKQRQIFRRMTPQQRLLGPAAGGDVARTRFRKDYTVQEVTEETLGDRPCWRLDLTARSPALSARTVRLWVAGSKSAGWNRARSLVPSSSSSSYVTTLAVPVNQGFATSKRRR